MAYCFSCERPVDNRVYVYDRPEISALVQSDCENGMFCFDRECLAHGVYDTHPSFRRTDESQYERVREVSGELFRGCQEEIVFEFATHPGNDQIKCPRLFFADGCSMELYPGPLGTICLHNGVTRAVRTGVRIAKWPQNCVGIVSNLPRNAASGVLVAHTVLDSNFPGEICVVLSNFREDRTTLALTGKDPIAMLTFVRAVRPLITMRAMKGLVEVSTPREEVRIYRTPPVRDDADLSDIVDRPPRPISRRAVLRCMENVSCVLYLIFLFRRMFFYFPDIILFLASRCIRQH